MQYRVLLLVFLCWHTLHAQESKVDLFLTNADTLHPQRFYTSLAAGGLIYGSISVGLWNAWYKDFETGSFRTFNDWGEWNQVDKAGHFFTAYNESRWLYRGAKWTGLSEPMSILAGAAGSTLLQTTLEVMDGHSVKWGFSWGDVVANTAGTALFTLQQMTWKDQRIVLKLSNRFSPYPEDIIYAQDGITSTTLDERGRELYGSFWMERLLKDYNNQTNWISFNLSSFGLDWSPDWVNVAIGYSAENLYGGFSNQWRLGDQIYVLDSNIYPRARVFWLSPDIDFTRIKTNKKWLRTIFYVINFAKMPAPALSYSTQSGLGITWIRW